MGSNDKQRIQFARPYMYVGVIIILCKVMTILAFLEKYIYIQTLYEQVYVYL